MNSAIPAQTSYPEESLMLTERRHEYGTVYTYAFKPAHPVLYTAGQYGHVRIAGLPEGVRAVREYSFASAPHEEYILFGVDSRSESPYQKALSGLSFGETVGLFKIKGHLTWPSPESDLVMIAGGVGVTPFRSILSDLAISNKKISTTLIHASRDYYLYGDVLWNLADSYQAVRHDTLNDTIEETARVHPDSRYFVAGSPAFVANVVHVLKAYGISRIDSDEFKGLAD
jgi:ferredoxin-NADP reductase